MSDTLFTTGNPGITESGIISLSLVIARRSNNTNFRFYSDHDQVSKRIREYIPKWDTFTMGCHRRVGQGSPTRMLYLDVLEMIFHHLIDHK